MQKLEGTHVNHSGLIQSVRPSSSPLPADAWAWADSRNSETDKAKVRWAVFSSAVNGPVLEGTAGAYSDGSAEVDQREAKTPEQQIREVCAIAGRPAAADQYLAQGMSVEQVEMNLFYALHPEQTPVVQLATKLATEAKRSS